MILNFGKHKGKELNQVADEHPAYLYSLLQHTEEQYKGTFYNKAWYQLETGEQFIPFGKNKGFKIKELKTDYLQFLLDNTLTEDGWLKYVVQSVLDRRNEKHIEIPKPKNNILE